ncbi:MAG: T9SS type A sorting domain-containing protein [Paludibacteraceae bacterium]
MKTSTKLSLIVLLLCSFSFAKAQLPPTAPPDLEYDAENILSYFSEKYGEFAELSTPTWGQTCTWDYTATGDDAAGLIVIRNLAWLPIQNSISAETKKYSYFHVDIFCNETTDFRIGFHSNWPTNSNEVYFPAINAKNMVAGKWYSIDYPMSELIYDANNEVTSSWTVEGGNYANANLLRIGNATDLFTYSDEIYITNVVLFNGEPTCLGGVVRDNESGIFSKKNDYGFKVYVSNGSLNCTAPEIIKKISIYSLTGQMLNSFDTNKSALTADLSSLSPGVYVVSAEFVNGVTTSKRFVK